MFVEMRRKEKALSKDRIEEILLGGDYGTLCLTQPNGYPYGLPINYVYDKGKIYFHGARQGQKNLSMEKDPRLSFSVVEDYKIIGQDFDTHYSSALVFGRARELDASEKLKGLRLLIEKYSPDFKDQGASYIERAQDQVAVFEISIDHMTGKLGR